MALRCFFLLEPTAFSHVVLMLVWTQPYSEVHVMVLSHLMRRCAKKNTAKNILRKAFIAKAGCIQTWSGIIAVVLSFHLPKPKTFIHFDSFQNIFNTLSTMLGTWVSISWCKYFYKSSITEKRVSWMCERVCVCMCVCMIYIYSIYEYIILRSIQPWSSRLMWQCVGRWWRRCLFYFCVLKREGWELGWGKLLYVSAHIICHHPSVIFLTLPVFESEERKAPLPYV